MPGHARGRNTEAPRYGRLGGALGSGDCGDCGPQLLRPLPCFLRSARREQDGELLATETPEDIALVEMVPARRDCSLEHEVARGVAVLVVDRFEVIQIAQNDAQVLAAAPARFQRLLRQLNEVRPITDAREPVEPRQCLKVQLRALGAISPQADEQHGHDQQQDVQPAGLHRLARQFPFQLQHVVLLVERIHLQLVGNVLVIDLLEGQVTGAEISEIGLICGGELLVIVERGLKSPRSLATWDNTRKAVSSPSVTSSLSAASVTYVANN